MQRGSMPGRLAVPLHRILLVAAGLALLLPLTEPMLRGAPAPSPGAVNGLGSILLLGRDLLPPVLLLAAALLFPRSLSPRRGLEARGLLLLVMVAVLDLGTSAIRVVEAHLTRIETLAREPEAVAAARSRPGRVYIVDDAEPWRSASDQNLLHGVSAFGGYFSLPLHRFVQYQKAFWLSDQTAANLLDRAAVSTVVDAWTRPLAPLAHLDGVGFSPRSPLAVVARDSPVAEFRIGEEPARSLVLVSALQGSSATPDGATVANLVLEDAQATERRVPIRAGIETAERVCDSPCAHRRPSTHLLAWSRVDGRFDGAFFLARLPLDSLSRGETLRIENAQAAGSLLVFGLVLEGGKTTASRAVTPFMTPRYALLETRQNLRVLSNQTAVPRARVAFRAVEARGAEEALRLAASLPVDTVVLEADDGPAGTEGAPPRAAVPSSMNPGEPPTLDADAGVSPVGVGVAGPTPAVRFLRDEPLEVALEATLVADGYIILADTAFPGWTATVDGSPARIRRADSLFRAVRLPPGRHEVVFRYTAASFHRGLWLCAAGLLVGIAVLVIPWRPRTVAGA